MAENRTFKVVLQYEVTQTHQVTIFVDAADEREAESLAFEEESKGMSPWQVESEHADETYVAECEIATPHELASR